MALSHLHLVINHVPVIGTVIAVALLLLSLVRRSEDLRRAGLEVSFLVGLITLPVYISGVFAMQELQDNPEVSRALIDAHHDAALLGSILMLLTGVVAWVCLWQIRRMAKPASAAFGAVVLLSVVTLVVMGGAANQGGQIRHPEVSALQGGAQAAASGGWVSARAIGELATTSTWLWPAAEALHFIGLWLLFGTLLAINLRLVGGLKAASFQALHRLLPWTMLGLVINTVTGMLFVIGASGQYVGWPFYWKIGLLVVGGLNLFYLTIVDAPWRVGPNDAPPMLARTVAGVGIVAWLGVMYFGRMLPFLGIAF